VADEPMGLLLLAMALAGTVPLWVVARPPLTDLPQHVHLTAVVGDLLFGGGSADYVLRPASFGYLLWYATAALLAQAVGPLVAVKLMLTAATAAIPLALGSLCRALGREVTPAFVALGLIWNPLLYLGFAQFWCAIPCAFFAAAAALRAGGPGGRAHRWRAAALGALATALHPMVGAVFVGLTLSRGRRPGAALAITVPAIAVAALWLLVAPAGTDWLASLTDPALETRRQDAAEALGAAPSWLADILAGVHDTERFAGWSLATLLGVVLGRGVRRAGVVLIVGGLLALYVLAPLARGWVWPIAPRFLVLGTMLLVVVLPFPERGWVRRGLVLAHVALAVVAVVDTAVHFRRFARESGDVESAIACVPAGAHLVAWVPDPASEHLAYWPYTHFAAFAQAERGGSYAFSFASHPSAPVAWRTPPPEVPPNGFQPHRVDPESALEPFDTVFVRGEEARLTAPRFERICAGGAWSVWRARSAAEVAGRSRPGPPGG